MNFRVKNYVSINICKDYKDNIGNRIEDTFIDLVDSEHSISFRDKSKIMNDVYVLLVNYIQKNDLNIRFNMTHEYRIIVCNLTHSDRIRWVRYLNDLNFYNKEFGLHYNFISGEK